MIATSRVSEQETRAFLAQISRRHQQQAHAARPGTQPAGELLRQLGREPQRGLPGGGGSIASPKTGTPASTGRTACTRWAWPGCRPRAALAADGNCHGLPPRLYERQPPYQRSQWRLKACRAVGGSSRGPDRGLPTRPRGPPAERSTTMVATLRNCSEFRTGIPGCQVSLAAL